jgi:predicted O-methyltransferase YrrM
MKFVMGDAFGLELDSESIDLIFADFGVGDRMNEFLSRNWESLRPGGFLVCHSTLTNTRTRKWLDSLRKKEGSLPPEEYEMLSLLEPHKRFQNSITIVQKRKGYTEPIYSEFA